MKPKSITKRSAPVATKKAVAKKSAPTAAKKAKAAPGSTPPKSPDHDPVLAAPLRPTAGHFSSPAKFVTNPGLILEQPQALSTLKPKNPGTGAPSKAGRSKGKK